MPTNKNVLVDRELFIGGSEISTILGINHFQTRYDLLLSKAKIKELEVVDNPYAEYGNEIEHFIRDYINEKMYSKDNFKEDTIIKEEDVISLRCNYDGLNSDIALEIKSTSVIHKNIREYKYYLVQLLYGMKLANVKKGLLAIYHRTDFNLEFDPIKLTMYFIDIEDYKDYLEEIEIGIENFKRDLTKLRENPFLTEEDLIPKELVNISNSIVELENELSVIKEKEKQLNDFKEELRNKMTEKGIKKWLTPNGIKITNVLDSEDKEVKKFNENKFKEECEELYERYLEPKIQKGKKGYLKITIPSELNEN